MKPRELERLLLEAGWERIPGRGRGSHRLYRHARRDEIVTLPWHNRDLPPGTLHAVMKAAGLR